MQPAVISAGESGFFLTFFAKILPGIFGGESGEFILRKMAHGTEYLILGLLSATDQWQVGKRQFRDLISVLYFGLGIAFIDETIQLFVKGRSGEVRDIWIDFAGVCIGTLLVHIIGKLLCKRR